MARFSGVAAGTVPANTNVLVSTTLPKVQPDIVDNFFTATPLFFWLRQKGRIMTWDGGESLEIPIMFDENPYARAYRPYEVMDVGPPQGITTATYNLARYRIPIMYDNMTALANSGSSGVVNLVQALKMQAQKSLVNAVNTDLFDEANTDSWKIGSILVEMDHTTVASQTAVVGGIGKSSYSWWRNQNTQCATTTGLLDDFRQHYMECSNGSDTPDLCIGDEYSYMNLEKRMADKERIVNKMTYDFGFDSLSYKGMTIMWDKTIPDDGHDGATDGAMLFLNTSYIKLAIASSNNFRIITPEWDKYQDAYVGAIQVYMQLVFSNMARQGVMVGTAWEGVA